MLLAFLQEYTLVFRTPDVPYPVGGPANLIALAPGRFLLASMKGFSLKRMDWQSTSTSSSSGSALLGGVSGSLGTAAGAGVTAGCGEETGWAERQEGPLAMTVGTGWTRATGTGE